MNIQTTKLELIKMIADVQSEQLLDTLLNLLKQESIKESNKFWIFIEKIDWSQKEEEDRLKPLIDALAKTSIPTIHEFSEQLAFYLHQLDGPAYYEALKNQEQGLSADTFLYARCMTVAKGKAFYIDVLDEPEKMPTGEDFEALLYVDEQAFEQKTGEKYDYVPSINYESFFNRNLWKEQAILF